MWYAQDKNSPSMLYYAFIVENPNQTIAVTETEYQVVAYDLTGTILGTATANVSVIFPAETQGLAGQEPIDVPEKSSVAKVDVQVMHSGVAHQFDFTGSPFTTDKVTYFPDPDTPRVSGIVKNLTANTDFTNLTVSAIAYDAKGMIVGAGSSEWISSLSADSTAYVVIDIKTSGNPAKVVLFPALSEGWQANQASPQQEPVQVLAVGASEDQYGSTTYGFVVKNTDTKNARVNIECDIAAFNDSGEVIATTNDMIGVIFPGERQAAAGDLSVPQKMKVAKMEVVIHSSTDDHDEWGLQAANVSASPLTVGQGKYLKGDYQSKVTGILKSSWGKDLANIKVTVIAYDASGNVIGGGSTYIDNVPANGQVAIEIPLSVPQDPAKLEIYPSFSSPPQW